MKAFTVFSKKRALLQSSQYDSEIIETMSRMERWDELAKWYQGRTNDSALSEDDTRDIIRSLIVKRPELAKGILEALPENRRSGYTWYLAALIDLENNNPDEAYSKLLKTVLNYPFTYEWVIAKELELELRTNREAQFKEAVQAKMAYLPGYSLKKRFYLSLGLKETAPEFYKDNLQQMKESYEESLDRQGIQAELPLSQEIKSILKSKSNELIYLGPELLNTLVRLCGDDPDLYSANLDLFEKIGQAGYATHKLNHLVSRDLGGRQYLPLLSKKLQKALYPDEYFDRVVSNCGNTNDALWYLSAFREESHFKTDSLSRSGAVGLAQLMPKTAEAVMRNMKKPDWNVYDSEDNLLIGLAHFKSLFRKYKGNAAHALAAYNAGESVVNHWIRTNKHDIPLWTEMIDYEETRDYVRKIVLTRYFYQYIYKIKNP